MAESLSTGTAASNSSRRKSSELRAQLGLSDTDPMGNGNRHRDHRSGIAPVPDLASRITAFYDFTNGQNAVASAPLDGYGHGTHVAGLARATARCRTASSPASRRMRGYRSSRPRQSGAGSAQRRHRSRRVRRGQQGRARHRRDQHVAGHPPFETAATDPMVQAVEAATRAGIIVVVSAGNAGINPSTGLVGYGGILAPGNAPSAFTIASAKDAGHGPIPMTTGRQLQLARADVDRRLRESRTSRCRGTTSWPFAPGSFLGVTYPSLLVNDASGHKTYISLTGTSMRPASKAVWSAGAASRRARETSAQLGIHADAERERDQGVLEYSAFTMHNAQAWSTTTVAGRGSRERRRAF